MLRDFMINVFALTSIVFFFGQLTKNKPLTPPFSFSHKVGFGVLAGLFGNMLMYFTLPIADGVIVDLRNVPVLITAVLGGFYPSIIAAVIVAAGRLLFFGISNASLVAASNMVLLGLGFGLLNYLLRNIATVRRMRILNVYHMIQVSFVFYLLFKDSSLLLVVLPYYWLFSILGAEITLSLTMYLQQSNEMFRRFRDLASKDFLTGLSNVRSFDATLNQNLEQAHDRGERVSLLFVDIDHFKHVNDTYGHPAGDEVLKQLGQVLVQSVRSFDIVSRNGGEEFSAILADCQLDRALEIGERVRAAVESHAFHLPDGQDIHITVSIGVSTYPDTADTSAALLQQADDGLYVAKRTGRNKVCSEIKSHLV